MHGCDALPVHRDPGPNEQHRCADRSDQICQERTDKKKQRVSGCAAGRPGTQVNSARYDEKRADYDHESYVVNPRMNYSRSFMDDEDMIEADETGKDDAELVVVTLPTALSDQRTEGDSEQQQPEWQHDWPVWLRGEQPGKHSLIALAGGRLVNQTRRRNADGLNAAGSTSCL